MNAITEVALAGFLHDIGKPLQRAEAELSDQARRMESMLCPSDQGRPSHLHVLWTNDFLENHLRWLPEGLNRSRISQLASAHHRPGDPEHFLISEADRLASGHDRRAFEASERRTYKEVPLSSSFTGLRLRERASAAEGCYVPQPLRPDESLFPGPDPRRSLVPEYRAVMTAMEHVLDSWPTVPPAHVCEAITSVSQEYLTCIPASTIDEPDVSLHDHASLVAAFAGALYAYHQDTSTFDERSIRDRSTRKYLLISGDLSGIQSYLFAMPTEGRRGRARAYRARSFYLAMLTHAASIRLLDRLRLTPFNRVMDAGGRFVLLAPNTDAARDAIAAVRRECDEWFLHEHGGRLLLTLDASVQCAGEDFMGDRFRDCYRWLQHAADTAKRRKLAAWLQPGGCWHEGNQRLTCSNMQERDRRAFDQDAELGRQLPRATYVGLWASQDAPAGLLDEPRDLIGYRMQLFNRSPGLDAIASAASFFRIRASDPSDDWTPLRAMAGYVPRFTEDDVSRLNSGGQADDQDADEEEQEPVHAGAVMTFEHLAQLSKKTPAEPGGKVVGQAAIACLKADVDRLGFLFSNGFEGRVSFGRVATLSRTLDFFFRSFLPTRFTDRDSPYRHVYVVFAGGDDLMLVGPWHVMFRLAGDLRGWFGRLAAGNADVTLSAGLAVGHGRTPISSLAAVAEEQLQLAKNAGRNQVAVFGTVFTWEEYASALEDGRRLDRLLENGDQPGRLSIRPGFVYRLLQYERNARRVEEARAGSSRVRLSDLHEELTWRSHLSYDLERNIRRGIRSPVPVETEEDLHWLESLVGLDVRSSPTRRLRLAATYALYRNRGG